MFTNNKAKISQFEINKADTFKSYALAAAAAARFYGDSYGVEYAERIKEDAREDLDDSIYVVQFYSWKDPACDDVFVAKISK